jgi:transposase
VSDKKPLELRVSVDVGYRRHSVAIGLPSGEVLEEFEISHRPEGFEQFFTPIEKHRKEQDCGVAVAMEGFNGCARPLDSMVGGRGYRLYNINNLKLARFKEIFPGAAKSDRIDARKGLELFQLRDHLPLAKEVLQEVKGTPHENEVLKRLTRRRRRLVDERVRVISNLQTDLQAVCPGLLEITKAAGNQWFLNFLVGADTVPQLARLRQSSLLKIPAVGRKYASLIQDWQKRAHFSEEVEWVSEMIQEDAGPDGMIRSCNDIEVFRGAWDQTFTSGVPGFAPLPQVSLSTRLSINNSGLSIDLLVMSLQQPASGRSLDPWPRAGTSRRGGGRLSNN